MRETGKKEDTDRDEVRERQRAKSETEKVREGNKLQAKLSCLPMPCHVVKVFSALHGCVYVSLI